MKLIQEQKLNNLESASDSDSNESDSSSSSGSSSNSRSQSSDDASASDKNDSSSEAEDQNHNTSVSSHNSKNSSSSSSRPSKHSEKKYWEENPDIYGIRRSGRERKQPERISLNRKLEKTHRSAILENDSSCSESDYEQPRLPPRLQLKRNRSLNLSDSDQRLARNSRGNGEKVSYRETSEEEDDEDVEGIENVTAEPTCQPDDDQTQTIDKIIDSRLGKKGAVGMQTYIYEVDKKGDPNTDFDPNDSEQVETQYLIKWKGWAHIHNTWESEDSLLTQKFNDFQVKGLRKLENFQNKKIEYDLFRNRNSIEEVEYLEIQLEMERNMYASHLLVERIFSEAEENGNTYYYVKWRNLPYSDATWELEELVKERFSGELEKYLTREASPRYPGTNPVTKHRPKFVPQKTQPNYIGGGNTELKLRDYQLDGVNWLVHAWSKFNSVILADEMGLGKTIQTISFLNYLFHEHNLYGPFLIVLPLSTVNAWQQEFAKWAPDINVIVYIGNKSSRTVVHEYEWVHQSRRIKFNALLTTYEILLRDKDLLQEACQWSVLMIDEAHRLKNEESQLYKALKEFKTNHRLLITGTPLQNSLKELWALLHFIMPSQFDDWESFERQHDGDKMKTSVHRLHQQLEPYLLRRVKKDVEKSLPAKVEQILRIDMTTQQKQYYKWILTKNYEMLKKGARGTVTSFVNVVMELKKCCNHSFLTKPPDAYPSKANEMLSLLLRGSGKLNLLDKLLVRLHETHHRVLIFSQMVRMLDILAQYLKYRRFPFQRLDGSISGDLRRQALDHFNAEGSTDFCFLLSTRAGGLGINLATADTVIIFDSDWNPQNDLQAQARAHRIGQKNQVNIYRLVTKKSIEEEIIERAKQKMVLDHLVIQSMDTSGRTVFNKKLGAASGANMFNKEELNSILKFGADDLFKDDDSNDEEPVCDIDEILQRAETRDEGPASASDELLSAFKVASFSLDEEAKIEPVRYERKDWDDIIPEDVRQKAEEETRRQEMEKLYLPPRNRKCGANRDAKMSASPVKKKRKRSCSSDYSDEGKPKKRGRPRMHHKETVKNFTDVEVRRFFKSFKKFSNPMRRLDTIASDAELRDKSLDDLHRLGEIIIARCREELRDFDGTKVKPDPNTDGTKQRNSRGPSFKLSAVAINARTTLATIDELAPLDDIVPHTTVERASWIFPVKRVKDAHWDIPWGSAEDSRLLKGVYEYGMGSWDQIKGDQSLNLGEKILLPSPLKPQAKHLENRVQYLLKLVKSKRPAAAKRGPKPKNRKPKEIQAISKAYIDHDDSSDDDATRTSLISSTSKVSTKEPSKEEKLHQKDFKLKIKEIKPAPGFKKSPSNQEIHKKKRDKKEKSSAAPAANGQISVPDKSSLDSFDVDHPYWGKVKELMRPAKKALKQFDKEDDSLTKHEQLVQSTQFLLEIGDHINKVLSNMEEPDFWRAYMWAFVSRFSKQSAKTISQLYTLFHEERKDKKNECKQKKHEKKHHKRKKDDDAFVQRKHHNGYPSESRSKYHEDNDKSETGRPKESSYPKPSSSTQDYQSPIISSNYPRESRYPQDFGHENCQRESHYPNPKQHNYRRDQSWRGRERHHRNYSPPGSHYRGSSSYYGSYGNRDSHNDRLQYPSYGDHRRDRRPSGENRGGHSHV